MLIMSFLTKTDGTYMKFERGIKMYQRNLKYVKGHDNKDGWENIPKELYDATLKYLAKYAKEKGFDVPSYMEFVKENVVREV